MATSHQLDQHAARQLHEAVNALRRAFSEGLGNVRDFPETLKAYKELGEVLDKEAAVETSIAIRERMAQRDEGRRGGGKNICVMVDGSFNSITALRWTIEHVVTPRDDLFLVTVTPFEDYTADATRILQEAYDYAHNAGVAPQRLHVRTLVGKGSSKTKGVGESIVQYVEENRMSLVVLGSRGMGSIKRNLLGLIGMGSVSEFCTHNLKCPITIMKDMADGGTEAETITPIPDLSKVV